MTFPSQISAASAIPRPAPLGLGRMSHGVRSGRLIRIYERTVRWMWLHWGRGRPNLSRALFFLFFFFKTQSLPPAKKKSRAKSLTVPPPGALPQTVRPGCPHLGADEER